MFKFFINSSTKKNETALSIIKETLKEILYNFRNKLKIEELISIFLHLHNLVKFK